MRSAQLLASLLLASSAVCQAVQLYDNGPLATHPTGGAGGAAASSLQAGAPLFLNLFGNNVNQALSYAMADDFTVLGNWNLQEVELYVYQTGSTTTSTITGAYVQIWNGPPDLPTSTPVAGNLTTNLLTASSTNTFSGIYRALNTTLTDANRPIMRVRVSLGATPVVLTPGVYWLVWQMTGSLASGPWIPLITRLGSTGEGNAKQRTTATTWVNLVDAGNPVQPVPFPQAVPFKLFGTASGNTPALAISYGAGKAGTNGVAAINSTLPRLGQQVVLTVTNGIAATSPFLLVGLSRANVVLPPLGTLYVLPTVTVSMPSFDATNTSTLRLEVPHGPQNGGVVIDLQSVFLDAGALGGISHTGGLEWLLGN